MNLPLKTSATKVQAFLSRYNQEFVVQQLPNSTRTALDAAQAIGCEVEHIAKSLVFLDSEQGEPILIIASGTNQVCLEKIAQSTGLHLKKADAKFVKQRTGFAIGGVPPVAHKEVIRTLLDQDLKQYSEIWAAAGTPNSVFKIDTQCLNSLTDGEWVDLAK